MKFYYNNITLDQALTWHPYDASTEVISGGKGFDIISDITSHTLNIPVNENTIKTDDVIRIDLSIDNYTGNSMPSLKNSVNDVSIYLNRYYYDSAKLVNSGSAYIFTFNAETIKSLITDNKPIMLGGNIIITST